MNNGITVFSCPGGCPPGECDTAGPGEEGRWPCAHCAGTGHRFDGHEETAETCPRCKGDGLGGGYSTATCSKCGQRAIDRAMWEGP
jgi:hypothetical protein